MISPHRDISPSASPLTREQQYIRQLEERIQRLERDKGILKKATVFDNIAPKTNSVRNIYNQALEKVNSCQTNSIVISLAETKASIGNLQKQFNYWPIKGLDKIIVIDHSGKTIGIK